VKGSTCKQCGNPICWVKMKHKFVALEFDSAAQKLRTSKTEGNVVFKVPYGYWFSPRGSYMSHRCDRQYKQWQSAYDRWEKPSTLSVDELKALVIKLEE
jgi:hypothetical protein